MIPRVHRALALLACVPACDDSAEALAGLGEPLRIESGTFVPGDLEARGEDEPALRITSIESASGRAVPGQLRRTMAGRVHEDAYAIAMRIADIGSGWWVGPVEELNPLLPGERDFYLTYQIGTTPPPGIYSVQLAGVDAFDRIGAISSFDICVLDGERPSGLFPCDPTIPPPAIVISLVWDRPVDLDLRVRTPEGRNIGWKRPTASASDASAGRLSRDSNAGCIFDGRSSEAVTWADPPPPGAYAVYVDLFDACGLASTTFTLTVYRRRERDDGSFALEQTEQRIGALIDLQTQGSDGPGLFVIAPQLP